ncbi:MAG: caspase family protein [Planctomycetota bacterium]
MPNDATVFVYFSGHGAKEAGESFWVTQDAELGDLAISALPDRDIRAFLDRIPSQRVVVMVDACYAAATVKEQKSVVDMASVLARFTGQGRAFLSAAGSGEEAIEAADLKHSVFTHYLVHGLRGRADTLDGGGNGDGVVVLPELTSYIDRHVAEQARVRGGIQKPVVDFDNVQEPAKFRLTIDADVIQRNLRESAESKALKATRLAALESLYLDEKLTRDQTQKGLALLRADPTTLDTNDLKRLAYFQQVGDGTLDPTRLQRALDLIETPEQRAVRLAEEARERLRVERETKARERQAKIDELFAAARNNDNKADGRIALRSLEELLKLDPENTEAIELKTKIEGYYEPPHVIAARERDAKFASDPKGWLEDASKYGDGWATYYRSLADADAASGQTNETSFPSGRDARARAAWQRYRDLTQSGRHGGTWQSAAEWCQKAADQGNAAAMTNMGLAFENGLGVTKNEGLAFNWYQRGAEAGDARAMLYRAHAHRRGTGTAVSRSAAKVWYLRAAERGNADAMVQASLEAFFAGNDREAEAWAKKAADANKPTGSLVLAAIGMLNGDLDTAVQMHDRAVRAGSQAIPEIEEFAKMSQAERVMFDQMIKAAHFAELKDGMRISFVDIFDKRRDDLP